MEGGDLRAAAVGADQALDALLHLARRLVGERHRHDLVRRVSNAGTMRFQTRQLFIRPTLLQADIALEETADGIWSIYFSDVLLARLNARDFRL